MRHTPALLLALMAAAAPAAAQKPPSAGGNGVPGKGTAGQGTASQGAAGQGVTNPGAAGQGAAGDEAAGTALVDAFARFCLRNFPVTAPMESMAPGQVTEMPRARVTNYLHDDPGRGWTYAADGGSYVVTVEDPPFHTCAVRRLYAAQPAYSRPWLAATERWAREQGRGPFQAGPSQSRNNNGLLIEVQSRALPGQGGPDVFMELKTTYPDGRVEERLARSLRR